jgi:glutamate 5-kinase
MSATCVVKVGTSSLTDARGEIAAAALTKLCADVAAARSLGHEIVLVSSGAIAAGLPALGLEERPGDIALLQAVAAVGQPRLMERLSSLLASHGIVAGQVLLTPYDFIHRSQYLHARATLQRLLALGVIPIVNENDTVADDEIRYGDNDRLAALVSHLVAADVLCILTDQPGVLSSDPRFDAEASLIEEIAEVDAALESVAGGAGTDRGSGGMASKLAAAKIAAWSGVRVVISGAKVPEVVVGAIEQRPIGTAIHARATRLSSRKLWIAFARGATGRVIVDEGAERALRDGGKSLLPAGVRDVDGTFEPEEAVEVVGADGRPFAKGLVRFSAGELRTVAGRRTSELPEGTPQVVIHRDDLVVLP